MWAKRYPFIALVVILGLALTGCGTTLLSTPTPTAGTPGAGGPSFQISTPTPGGSVPADGLPDVAGVVERAAPAVVSVLATVEERNPFGRVFEQQGQGSGVIFDSEGYILTNNHVVENAVDVEVVLVDQPAIPAEVVGTDPDTDLAVLKIDPSEVENLVTAPLGNTDSMRIGDWVVAIGNPLGLSGSVTVGVISAKDRRLSVDGGPDLWDLVQTDALINPGNSGGPLLSLNGEVIGINTAIIRGTIGAGAEAEGIGFAISMNTAAPVARQLVENGEVIRPRLGVGISEVTPVLAAQEDLPVDEGVIVREVVSGRGAAAAGMQEGDIIVGLEGQPVASFTDLQRLLISRYAPGDAVEVEVARGNIFVTLEVILDSAEND